MNLPKTYNAYRRSTGPLPHTIELTTESLPANIAPNEVIIKIHAVSVNYRDVSMLQGKNMVPVTERGISCSDCAAEVVSMGSAVQDFQIGDRVAPIFNLNDVTGKERDTDFKYLGNDLGVLSEFGVFHDSVLVKLPKHLSWEEASTISCAGVTAWCALGSPQSVDDDTCALLKGTGGVSMFALHICLAAGIQPLISSSSDEKLASIRENYHGTKTFNYVQGKQSEQVKNLTDGKGVDIVLNTTGLLSIPEDLESLRKKYGKISLLGNLEGPVSLDWDHYVLAQLITKVARIQGFRVGSKVDNQNLNRFLEEKNVRLSGLIDRTFSFEDAKAGFGYLEKRKHVGKVVIKVHD